MIIAKWLFIAIVLFGVAIFIWRNMNPDHAVPSVAEFAPNFDLPDQQDERHSLSSYHGQWLVLYFYPKDDTPGCTQQACKFRDDFAKLNALGAKVVGISLDDRSAHERFSKKYSLPFTLLSDAKGEVAARYGSLTNLGVIKFAKRNTFLIDPNGKIAKIYLGADTAHNSEQVLNDLSNRKKS